MMSSLATMNENIILDIISHCPATEIGKFRLLNKEFNKRTYQYFFLNHHLHRTNSVFGYFIRYYSQFKHHSKFVSGIEEEEASEKNRISLEFLPSQDVKIEACDTRNGILLCVDDGKFKGGRKIPDYIVCKPATKEYRIIPNPKTRYHTVATGLMVIQTKPFRYKIIRVSEPMRHERRKMKEGFYKLNCEVFDSESFSWKRLNDLELQGEEFFRKSDKPVLSYGLLHWLTTENNVIRFCMRTETWSFFPVPIDIVDDECLALVSYEGKLGVVNSRQGDDLWVLEKSFVKSWIKVKDVNIKGSQGRHVKPLWFPSSDVVSMAGFDRIGLYNTNSNKSRYLHMKTQDLFIPSHESARDCFIPFYSNYETVGLNKDSTAGEEGGNIKDMKKRDEVPIDSRVVGSENRKWLSYNYYILLFFVFFLTYGILCCYHIVKR